MHKSEGLISGIYFGFNLDTLFLRIDPKEPFDRFEDGMDFTIMTSEPAEIRIVCPVKGEKIRGEIFEKQDETWVRIKSIEDVAIQEIFEIGIPFADLRAAEKDLITLFISLRRNGEEIERCPWRGHINITVPTADFEAMMWY